MKRTTLNPKSLFNSEQYGFSQVVISEHATKHIFMSGQVAWDEEGNIVGKDDLAVQTKVSIENIGRGLNEAGAGLEHVVSLRIYVVDYQGEYGPIITDALNHAFGKEHQPAATWISVSGLANEDFLIEIEAQAVI